jgi:hypothetical protein
VVLIVDGTVSTVEGLVLMNRSVLASRPRGLAILFAVACAAGCSIPDRIIVVPEGGAGDGDSCPAGRIACGGEGCVDPSVDPAHCGACDNACSPAQRCVGGACVAGCPAGRADCDSNEANMCEVDTTADLANCGACGRACALANAVGACADGQCSVRQCADGFGDCDNDPANGCEANLQTDGEHCGACGTQCAGQFCVAGTCQTACPSGQTACGTSCVVLVTNADHCGMCDRACPSGPNGTARCAGGACGLVCAAGYGNCDNDPATGCEAAFASNPAHCGGCNSACRAPANATPTCTSGACGSRCNLGFANCNGLAADGCEASLTSASDCGACGNVCPRGTVCRSAGRTYSCASIIIGM